MSFYATLAGYIQYRTLACLETALGRLQTGGWLDDRQRWRVDGRVIEHGRIETIDTDQLVLVIPPGLYRNLARITTRLFVGATDGVVVISSTDGCFDGWIERPLPAAAEPTSATDAITSIDAVDLEAFARESGLGVKRFERTPPDEYATWQEYLEVAGELLQTPAMIIQLAMREHDRQTTEAAERVLEEGQQRLSDELDDIIDLPGIEVDTEAALSDREAQRIQDHVQQQLDDL